MAMSDADQTVAIKHLVRKIYSDLKDPANLDVTQLKAAAAAVWNALETNCNQFTPTQTIEAALNGELPEPTKTNLTQAQKGMLLAYVAMKKYGVI